jgi:GNAT superfamily N-acetyltransferase
MAEPTGLGLFELTELDAGQLPPPFDLPPGIGLRPANLAADLPAIDELSRAAFAAPAGSARAEDEAGNQAEIEGLLRHPGLVPPGIFLAMDGKLAVGLAAGRIEVPAAGEGTRRAAVELLAVRPGYRRKGIARALLRQLLDWLAERGVQAVLASTDDPIVANLLEGYGFRASPSS